MSKSRSYDLGRTHEVLQYQQSLNNQQQCNTAPNKEAHTKQQRRLVLNSVRPGPTAVILPMSACSPCSSSF